MTLKSLVGVTPWKTATLTEAGYPEDQSERRGNSLGICFADLR